MARSTHARYNAAEKHERAYARRQRSIRNQIADALSLAEIEETF